jgi:hypothetical protein
MEDILKSIEEMAIQLRLPVETKSVTEQPQHLIWLAYKRKPIKVESDGWRNLERTQSLYEKKFSTRIAQN